MALTMVASAVFQIICYRNSTRLEDVARRDAHARDVMVALAGLRSAVQDTGIDYDEYLLSGDSRSLESYRSAAVRVPALLQQVRALTADDPVQAASASALQSAIDTELQSWEQDVDVARLKFMQGASASGIVNGVDAQRTGRIRLILEHMSEVEQHLRTGYLAQMQDAAASQSHSLVSASVYRVFVLLAGCTLILRQQARQRRTERHCRQSEELFRNAFDHTATGMAMSDENGRWVKVNRALCELVGHTETELLTRGSGSIMHPDDVDTERGALAGLSAGSGNDYQLEVRFIHKDGRTVWALVTNSVVRNEDGRPQTFIAHVQDITERRQAEDRLRHLSLHDALTGLPNRRLLVERIQRGIERAKQDPNFRLAVLFLDLDHFKQINDSLGHAAGDKLLIAVAERLGRCVRAGDPVVNCDASGDSHGHTVARLAGDEFTVLLEGLRSPADALAVAQRILRELATPVECCGQEVRAAASIGIVHGDARRYSTARELLADADAALYKAKAAGRARYAVFEQDLQTSDLTRLAVSGELRRAG
ncbi:MAG TPA: diguanylate cyclase [Tepidisphaeraceae bacterium]|nr:diguanylate cyclase [Tepidisphaeraceae bacterium]